MSVLGNTLDRLLGKLSPIESLMALILGPTGPMDIRYSEKKTKKEVISFRYIGNGPKEEIKRRKRRGGE